MSLPLFALLASALAAPVTAPDGSYTLDAAGFTASAPDTLVRGREAFSVQLRGARDAGDLGVLEYLRGASAAEGSKLDVYTWQGKTQAGLAAACLDTRKVDRGLRTQFQTWCGAELGDGKIGLLVMSTRDVLQGRTFGGAAQRLVETMVGPGGAGAATDWPARLSGLVASGYRCAEGRWNDPAGAPDLRLFWKADTGESYAKITAIDGGGVNTFILSGTLSAKEAGAVGKLSRVYGPEKTASGVHRLFASLEVEIGLRDGVPASFRAAMDSAATDLSPCP